MTKRHPLHNVYYNMKQRCLNKNRHDFKYYGGRGIKICARWLESFENFVEDMYSSYSPGLTLDRIEVNGDYAPDNCRWVTMSVQCKNKRTYDNSPCGISGVSRHGDRWRARAYGDKKAISLGVYDTENEAILAVKKFKEKQLRRLIVISGAGFSAESGVRTFRTDTDSGKALWDEYDLEEVCNIHAFRGNFYHKTHMFYNKRRSELQTVHPNAAHLRVAEWYKHYPGQVVNLTTNVDDLLERAGVAKEDTLYIHGYLKEILVKDASTQQVKVVDVGYSQIDPDDYDWCKPNVIFFGENAPAYGQMYETLESLTVQDMVIVVGCSNTVINFNWELFPAVRRGTKVIVINPHINYFEQEQYDLNGVLQYRCGAVDAFSNEKLIRLVENHLEGKTPLQTKGE